MSNVVRDLARRMHSSNLLRLAQRMSNVIRHTRAGTKDPFKKVKKLIKDMIETLEADAQADATHKAYCDKELAGANEEKAEKEDTIGKLKVKIDTMMSKSAMLKDQVATLQKELAALASSQAEMDEIRANEKAAYDKNSADMQQGIDGITMALKVLRDYYSQDQDHDAAEGAAGGIIGMLEVIESDFHKGLSEMTVAEQTAAAEYKKETQENTVETAEYKKETQENTV